jgi:hypothetical protein
MEARAPTKHRTSFLFIRLRAMRVGQFGRHAIADSDVLQLTAFKGLRFKMGVHVGSDAGGLQGPAVT